MDVLKVAQTRYTTKAYNPNKIIPSVQFERFLETLRLAPSSINIQPWHFLLLIIHQQKGVSLKP